MKALTLVFLGLLVMGGGCSYKYDAKWNDQDKAEQKTTTTAQNVSCLVEGQTPNGKNPCCTGLTEISVDDAYSVCGKPGTGYKPRVCAAPGEIVTAQTPNCCAGLDVKEKDGKFICDYLK